MIDTPNPFIDALILVIDDEETQRLLTRDCLEEDGFKVEEASNGKDGLDRIRALRPDLVLLDVMMPGMDGFEVCQQVRADPEIGHTPVIIVTGREQTEDVKKGFSAGATDFLAKPVNWGLLPNRVRYVLRSSMLEQELRLTKEAAEKANEAKSILLATMGHELRTPLNAIIGFSDLMMGAPFGPLGCLQYEGYVADIHNSGKQLLDAINDILEIVNSESGRADFSQYKVGVAGLVGSVVRHFASEAEALGIKVVNDVLQDHVVIHGDEQRLRRALFNLVSNALKFNAKGGTVRIHMTVSEEEGLWLSITDTGVGIAAEDLLRIMEPFEQADHRLARAFEGLGLGIPVARAMVRLHGGEIAYESVLGEGTTARIRLPADSLVPAEFGALGARTG
jgi:signal transduction histidine kinase